MHYCILVQNLNRSLLCLNWIFLSTKIITKIAYKYKVIIYLLCFILKTLLSSVCPELRSIVHWKVQTLCSFMRHNWKEQILGKLLLMNNNYRFNKGMCWNGTFKPRPSYSSDNLWVCHNSQILCNYTIFSSKRKK